MEGDAIPEGYITNCLEVDINDGAMDISGFLGGLLWVHCCHCKFCKNERLGFPVLIGQQVFHSTCVGFCIMLVLHFYWALK